MKREEFLAALRSLRPVPEAEAEAPAPADETEDDGAAADSDMMAAIAAGVRAEARRGNGSGNGRDRAEDEPRPRGGALTRFGRGESRDRQVAVSEDGAVGPTFETLVQRTLAKELRGWLHDNLEEITEKVVRDEIRSMGRRRD